MAGQNTSKVVLALGGLAVAGLLAYAAYELIRGDEDEERPPIIVRNGSLTIQSGLNDSLPGKPWFEDAIGEWKQIHDAGRPTNVFRLEFKAAGTCDQVHTPEFVVGYDPDGGGERPEVRFVISGKPRHAGGTGTPGPAVEGDNLDNSNRRPTPLLRYGTEADVGVMRVLRKNGNLICGNVTEVTASPLQ